MRRRSVPSISVVVAAYQAQEWIAPALESILGQTRPPDEVIVVDDGSTDDTAREVARFGKRVRIVRQANGGCPAAFNRGFREATGDFIARTDADDLWEPRKLEWQAEAITAHPDVDVLFGHTLFFGRSDGPHVRPPGVGLLDGDALRDSLYRQCVICAPSVVIRRSLFQRLGPFIQDFRGDRFGAEDYEYWMRCLRSGARFYYDPRPLLRHRHHDGNLTNRHLWIRQSQHGVRRAYAEDISDRALVSEVLSEDLFRIGRKLVDEARPLEARRAFYGALRHARGASPSANVRALVWALLLGLPVGLRDRGGTALVGLSRSIDRLSGGRRPALPSPLEPI
jgi:glycosyltransferase involved in cell wall biosynthesis